MNDNIPAFEPSQSWYSDWPYNTSTIVRVLAKVTGNDAKVAVRSFLESIHHASDSTYYWGGYSVEVTETNDLVLLSAGEDGFSSIEIAAEDLVESLIKTGGDVQLSWEELPAEEAPN